MASAVIPPGEEAVVSFDERADVVLLSIENKPDPHARTGKPNEDRAYVGVLSDLSPLAAGFDIMHALQKAAQELSDELKESIVGSTAVMGFVWDGRIYIAHIGDATLGLVSQSEGMPSYQSLHPWHQGCVKLEYGQVNVGRAFGDKDCRDVAGDAFGIVDCTMHPVAEDDFILASSDGVSSVIGDTADQGKNDAAITEFLQRLHHSGQALSPAGITSAVQAQAMEFRKSAYRVDDFTLVAAKPRQGALFIVADGHGPNGTNAEVAAAIIRAFPAKWAACLGRDLIAVSQTDEAEMNRRWEDHRLASFPCLESNPMHAPPLTEEQKADQVAARKRLPMVVMTQSASYPPMFVAPSREMAGAFATSALSGGSSCGANKNAAAGDPEGPS